MARRRPNRITRPVAGHTAKALPTQLATAGGQIHTAEQLDGLVRQQAETGALAQPLPRDWYPYAFGPGVPLTPAPLDPTRRRSGRAEPRIWEYPVTWNLPGTTTGRLVPWRTLRDAANLPLIRDCIRIRKAEIQGLDWDFVLSRRAVDRAQRDDPDASRLDVERQLREKLVGQIDRAVDFWSVPDRGNGYTFAEWICQFLEEQLVLDALAIYPRYTLGGQLYALEVLDGSTIKPLLDHRGGRPQPPQPAYQQILHGFPRGEFTADTSDTDGETVIPAAYTADQLIYIRREVRTHTPYGLSPVEQALADVDLWMKRIAWLRAEYTDGVMPSGWIINEQAAGGANTWTPQQVAEYERELNDYLSGSTANRMRYRILPPGFRPDDSGSNDQAEKYKPEFDLHLLKLVCAHFDVPIHELGFTEAKGLGSEGHAEGQDRLNERKGRMPVLRWIADLITDMSRAHLGLPRELEFQWVGLDDESDSDEAEDRTSERVAAGLLTLNEGRDELGRPRYTFPEADKAAIINGATITFVEGAEERAQAAQELAERAVDAKERGPAGSTGSTGSQAGGSRDGSPASSRPRDADTGGSASAKQAEAAAYRRWAAKGRTGRRFQLEHIVDPADLVKFDIDPSLVTFAADLGKGDAPAGGDLDRIAARCARQLTAAAVAAVDVDGLAHRWATARGLDKGLRDAVAAALAWLRDQAVRLAEALGNALREAVTDGYEAAERAAREQIGEQARSAAADRLQQLLDDAGVTITSVADSRFVELAEVLADAVDSGTAPRQLARELRGVLDAPQWAETVAVTETARAMSAATQATYQANRVEKKSWLLAPDQRVCPTCAANAAQGGIPTTDRFASGDLHPPAHPNCFPAGVVVTGPSAVAATARRYEGDLVTVVFADGEEVPVTPNHPVLTPDGWVPAGDLHEGAELLRTRDADAVARLVCPDDRQAVARIEDVAGALREAGPVASVLVPVAAEDFHGDGASSDEVKVVRAARHAELDVVSELAEHRGERGLLLAEGPPAAALGDPDPLLAGHGAATGRLVRCPEHGLPLVSGGPLPAQRHGGGPVAAVETEVAKHAVDRVAVDAVPGGEGLDGLAAEEVLGEVRRSRGDASGGAPSLGPTAQRHTAADEALAEGLAADAAEGRALADRLAGHVERDRVVELRRIANWSGHVFNLETIEGWYFANGIIAHNCRCALMPVLD